MHLLGAGLASKVGGGHAALPVVRRPFGTGGSCAAVINVKLVLDPGTVFMLVLCQALVWALVLASGQASWLVLLGIVRMLLCFWLAQCG